MPATSPLQNWSGDGRARRQVQQTVFAQIVAALVPRLGDAVSIKNQQIVWSQLNAGLGVARPRNQSQREVLDITRKRSAVVKQLPCFLLRAVPERRRVP